MDFSAVLSLLQTSVELGLVSGLTVLALFLSYTMLNVCDLSTDGCFTLGAAVGAVVAISGHPFLSIPAAMLAGIISGFVTGILQTRMGIDSLLSGIIVNTGLYSINIAIMGNSSLLNLNKTETVFTILRSKLESFDAFLESIPAISHFDAFLENIPVISNVAEGFSFESLYKLMIVILAVIVIIVFLSLFLSTRLGLAIRATGNNPDMVRSSSINPVFTTLVGLCVANAFTGLSGCMLGQLQKSVNIDIGTGMVTMALASLLIGRAFMGRGSITKRAVGAVLGAIIFRIVYAVALRFNMPAYMLKLISSIIVIAAISGPYLKSQIPLIKRRLTAGREV